MRLYSLPRHSGSPQYMAVPAPGSVAYLSGLGALPKDITLKRVGAALGAGALGTLAGVYFEDFVYNIGASKVPVLDKLLMYTTFAIPTIAALIGWSLVTDEAQ